MQDEFGDVLEVLRRSPDFTLIRARPSGRSPYLTLSATGKHGSVNAGYRFSRELELAPYLDDTWSVSPRNITFHDGREMLVLEDRGYTPLDLAISGAGGLLSASLALELAINSVRSIALMHASGIIHKDIKPANLFVDTDRHVRLTGFGLASRVRNEREAHPPTDVIAGTFAYMAPEQTGRMNRSTDTRSDLYSFGVTLYELFTGELPFVAQGPLEWIHCHIARQPIPPSERVPGISPALNAVILKLLAKNPDERYQTAKGAESDLRLCQREAQDHFQLAAFRPGLKDISDKLIVPDKIYGRTDEIERLFSVARRALEEGKPEIVLVSGYSGIGKTSIVNELRRSPLPPGTMFASGKFDQFKRDIPYATISQAFEGLIQVILASGEAQVAYWRDSLVQSLGHQAQLMIDLVPELERLIGSQVPIPDVQTQSAQSRFHAVFCKFLSVFATAQHPLVLFIDDLQWLDAGTLELLEVVTTSSDARFFLLLGAYRENEAGPEHPLMKTIAAIKRSETRVSEIKLGPLSIDELSILCADALNAKPVRTRQFAEIVFDKTAGNPFYAIQFVTSLAEEGIIAFHPESATWVWDINRVKRKGITDNLADLLSARIGRMSQFTKLAVARLACLGSSTKFSTLLRVVDCTEAELNFSMHSAVEAGIVARTSTGFAFTHDRMQEAAYALLPAGKRAAEHLIIGQALLSLSQSAEFHDEIFETTNQFNRGAAELSTVEDRSLVVSLNLSAGRRAKASGAYLSAQSYFSTGRRLQGEAGWAEDHDITLKLELEWAECEIVTGSLEAAENRLDRISSRVNAQGDRANVVCLSVLLYFSTGRNDRAVEVALDYLRTAGIVWPTRPTEEQVHQEYARMRSNLEGVSVAALVDAPAMSDPTVLSVMAVLTELFPAAYAVDRYLLELVLLRMTNMSLEYGNCESSSVAYSAINMALGMHFGDQDTAFQLGQLACQLVERHDTSRYKARVYSCFAAFTLPWTQHIPMCRPMMTQAFAIGSSMGDMAFAAYNSRNLMTHLVFSGLPLAQAQREIEQALGYAKGVQLGMAPERFIGQLDLVTKLRVADASAGGEDDGWASQNVDGNPGLAMMVCYYWIFRLQERYFASDFDSALDAARRIEPIRWATRSSIELADYEFFAGLSYAAAIEDVTPENKPAYLDELSKHLSRLEAWAKSCPENFANRAALVRAESARLQGRLTDAQKHYEKAILSSRTFGFLHIEALSLELAGECYLAEGLLTAAKAYSRSSVACYEQWGSYARVKRIGLRNPVSVQRGEDPIRAVTIESPVAHLDVQAVDEASQTLSREMILPALLEKLMRLAVEHAGAERGSLVILHDGDAYVEARATTGKGSVSVTVDRSRVEETDLPVSALNLVLKSGRRVILDDAAVEGLDFSDSYVRTEQPRSVLCLPITKDDQVIGALYLENNLTPRAFTLEKVAVLEFLASQAAIWLENARLYSELRRSEGWLREAQQLSSTGSFYWQVETNIVEFSEQMFRIYELDPDKVVTIEAIAARIHEDDRSVSAEMIEIARGPATDLDYLYRARMPDQSIKHLHLVAQASHDVNGRLVYTGAIQDITPRYHAEEALGKARSELAHVTRITTLGVLTASIAHEVNQPLLGIVMNASTCLRMLALDPPNIDGAKRTAERSIRDGNRAADVIKRLRALFGKKGTSTEPLDLNDAAREVVALSMTELQRSKIVLQTEFAADLPIVDGDRVQLQQVILNLLLNAADAMSGIEERPRRLLIRTEVDGDASVRLTVTDTGTGIPPELSEKLFEAFFTTKGEGMGMGLSVSRVIIESHRGRLWATPNEGPGASFCFSIPRTEIDPSSADQRSTG